MHSAAGWAPVFGQFDGVITKLYYQVDDIAQTGDPLVDVEVIFLYPSHIGIYWLCEIGR